MPLRDRWTVHQAGVTVLSIGFTPSIEAAATDAKISTGPGDVTGLFSMLQNTKFARDLALVLGQRWS